VSYLALARKWRPRRFEDVLGQKPVVQALTNALDGDRLHPALLLTGTRGVGKTTLGRIIAKGLNCETGVSASPCGQCAACREIDEGRFVDLLEIDAASRTKVDDTRQLLDNVQYSPVRGRYKVYLIDEVHMLSNSSFNALLKTLEEPPPHVKFILATTDPQKLPVTVLSRCLQFALRRLPPALIREALGGVLEKESIGFEAGAVAAIARAADGSMRDGLSLLDQAIAFAGGGAIRQEAVEEMIGSVGRRVLIELLQVLLRGDGAGVLACIERLDAQSPDYTALLNDLAAALQRIAVLQVLPNAADEDDDPVLQELAASIAPEDIQLDYQIAVLGRRDLPWAPEPRLGFEMTLLRMLTFRPEGGAAPPAPGGGQRGAAAAPAASSSANAAPVNAAAGNATAGSAASANADLGAATTASAAASAPAANRVAPAQSAAARRPAGAPPAPDDAVSECAGQRDPAALRGTVTAPDSQASGPAAVTPAVMPAVPAAASSAPPAAPMPLPGDDGWSARIEALGLDQLTRQLLRHSAWLQMAEDTVQLQLEYGARHLLTDERRGLVERALTAHLRTPLRLQVEIAADSETVDSPAQRDRDRAIQRQQAAEAAFDADPTVQDLRRLFAATVRPGSVQPLN
jgi:DNA polymerase-3 subunit gamma/tau